MALTTQSAYRKDLRTPSGVTMEHRHFAVIAATLRAYFDDNTMSPDLKQDMLDHWADAMARTNPKFNRNRFVRAVVGDK